MLPQYASRIGLVSWSLRADTPREMAGQLKSMKLTKLQLDIALAVDFPEAWGRASAVFADEGVRVVSGMWLLKGDVVNDDNWPYNLERTHAVALAAQRQGVASMTSHIGRLPPADDPAYLLAIERVKTLARILEDHGCRFLFETGPESSDRLCRFLRDLEQAGSPRIGINYDPANMLIYDTDEPIRAMRNFLPWIEQCHLKDARRPAAGQKRGVETRLGEGEVDWRAFLTVLAQAGYEGDLLIEREGGRHMGNGLAQDVADTMELIGGLMDKIGVAG